MATLLIPVISRCNVLQAGKKTNVFAYSNEAILGHVTVRLPKTQSQAWHPDGHFSHSIILCTIFTWEYIMCTHGKN